MHGCPGCADALFSRIANDTMAELHEQGRDQGRLPSAIYATGPEKDRSKRQAAHVLQASATTAALLRLQHQHGHDARDEVPWVDAVPFPPWEGDIPH